MDEGSRTRCENGVPTLTKGKSRRTHRELNTSHLAPILQVKLSLVFL
jgi:hypothetical protein